jgi:hypothetical protein
MASITGPLGGGIIVGGGGGGSRHGWALKRLGPAEASRGREAEEMGTGGRRSKNKKKAMPDELQIVRYGLASAAIPQRYRWWNGLTIVVGMGLQGGAGVWRPNRSRLKDFFSVREGAVWKAARVGAV